MNFSSTITKSLRRWLRIHPPGELSPLSIEKRPRRGQQGHQEAWSETTCAARAIGRFGKPIAPVHVRAPRTTPNLCIADNGKASTNASALVIETAITDNAQPFNQPWPPTGLGDGWHAVDKFSTRQRTFWRRIRLEYARPSPRARPVHR